MWYKDSLTFFVGSYLTHPETNSLQFAPTRKPPFQTEKSSESALVFQVLLLLVSERVINAGFVCFGWVILGESMTYSREISAVWWSILDLARLGFGNIFSRNLSMNLIEPPRGGMTVWHDIGAQPPPHSPVLTQKLYFALWRDNRGKASLPIPSEILRWIPQTGWCFQRFYIFIPIGGNDPIWRMFF